MDVVKTFLPFIIAASFVQSQLVFQAQPQNGFLILYNDYQLVNHTIYNPVVKIGIGSDNITDDHGNYEINDNVTQTRQLPWYQIITASASEIHIELTNDLEDFIMVDLMLVVDDATSDLLFTATAADSVPSTYNRIWVSLSATPDEKVFGAGEQYTYFNLRGRDYPIWTREQGVGRGNSLLANITNDVANAAGSYHTTYWPQGSFFSSALYSVLINNYGYMELRFSGDYYHKIYAHSVSLNMEFIFDSSAMGLVEKISKKIGTQPALPDWAMSGAILGLQRGTEEVLGIYEMAKEANVNVSGLWIQDWSGTIQTPFGYRVYWNWAWNETQYPGLDQVIQDLADENVQVTVYCNPHLIEGSTLYEEAASKGHLLLDKQGDVFLNDFGGFLGGTVDLVDASASAWYRDTLRENMLGLGIKGWMADFGEYTGVDVVSKNSQLNPEEVHNLIPRAWAETNREIVETGGAISSAMFWMRAGALGSSAFATLGWAGDQNVDFSVEDGLPSTIVAALSLSLSGMGLTHFDIGGYTTQAPIFVRTEELFLRSAEYAVFTPVMRTHEGNKPDSNHQFYSTNETLNSFARLTQLHSRLAPYTKEMVNANSNNGTPVQRPLFLHYENETDSWEIQDQYMFGSDLLVAPIVNEGDTSRLVYLPEDDWTHLLGVTGSVSGPLWMTVEVPMGYPAVFYRSDSNWADLFREITGEFGM